MARGLWLHRGIDRHALQVLGTDGASLVRHRQTFLDQRDELLLAEPLAPARHRRSIERQPVAEAQLAAEVLVIGVLDPAGAQHLIREIVHVLQDEQAGDKPRRQARLPRTGLAHRTKAVIQNLQSISPPTAPAGGPCRWRVADALDTVGIGLRRRPEYAARSLNKGGQGLSEPYALNVAERSLKKGR